MRGVRARGNRSTEVRLMRVLRANRVTGWRRHQPLLGHPDFTFKSLRLVVFCDGCFWHACPQHATLPVHNQSYWRIKILKNVQRDRRVTKSLRRLGWKVVRIWEHEIYRGRIPTKLACALRQQQAERAPSKVSHARRVGEANTPGSPRPRMTPENQVVEVPQSVGGLPPVGGWSPKDRGQNPEECGGPPVPWWVGPN